MTPRAKKSRPLYPPELHLHPPPPHHQHYFYLKVTAGNTYISIAHDALKHLLNLKFIGLSAFIVSFLYASMRQEGHLACKNSAVTNIK